MKDCSKINMSNNTYLERFQKLQVQRMKIMDKDTPYNLNIYLKYNLAYSSDK